MTAQDKRHTILFVDDEQPLREVMQDILELENFEVLTAGSGQEAIEIVRSNDSIDYIISDVRMPDGDGPALLKDVCEHRNRVKSGIPVMMLITGQSEMTREQAMQQGASDLMQKPLDEEKLIAKIKSDLAKHSR